MVWWRNGCYWNGKECGVVVMGYTLSGGVDVEGDAWHGKSGVGDRAR